MTQDDAMAAGARCDLCPLAKQNAPVVGPSPNTAELKVIVVGEGPGRTEEKLQAPFQGLSGKFLDERLRKDAKISRSAAYITNAALCRGESDKDNERAAECCAPRLLAEIAALPQKVPVAALGKTAVKSLLGARNILTARGFIWTAPAIDPKRIQAAKKDALKQETLRRRQDIAGRTVLPMLHPAFILRADTWKPLAEIDMRRLGRVIRGEVTRLEDDVRGLVGDTSILDKIPGAVVSCDIETDGIDAHTCGITLVQVADRDNVGLIWPWKDSYALELAWFLAGKEKVVFHNGNQFDLIVLEAHGCAW